MNYKLTGIDRINIPIILGKASIEGSETEIIAVRELKKEIIELVALSPEEIKTCNIKPAPGGGITWYTKEMLIETEIDLKKSHTELLKQCRETLDNKRLITEQLLDTCLKIKKMR